MAFRPGWQLHRPVQEWRVGATVSFGQPQFEIGVDNVQGNRDYHADKLSRFSWHMKESTTWRLTIFITFLLSVAGITRSSQAEEVLTLDRRIELETTVAGSLAEVWDAWTTAEGITSFFAPQADIKLEIGGLFELYFAPSEPDGSRGSEDCKVLSYLPREMISFSWNAPPSIPSLRDAGIKTWVVVKFEEISEKQVRILLTHLGIGEGEDWDKYRVYFTRAWPHVLENCQKRFVAGPIDWESE